MHQGNISSSDSKEYSLDSLMGRLKERKIIATLAAFVGRNRGFCPSCHAKRVEEWGEWMRDELLLDVSHRQVVFTIPKMLRVFFKYKRQLLSDLCLCGMKAILKYLRAATRKELTPGIIAVIQSFGSKINLHPHLHFILIEGGEMQVPLRAIQGCILSFSVKESILLIRFILFLAVLSSFLGH